MPLLLLFTLLTLLFTLPAPTRADTPPQVLVVIADHLTLSDVTNPRLLSLTRLRTRGQTALMSPGLAHGPDPALHVYATLGAGDSVRLGDKSQGLLARTLAQAHVTTTLIGTADSDEAGRYRPASLILPAAADPLSRDGTQPDPLSAGGRRTDPARLWQVTQSALAAHALVIVYDGDFARTERARQTVLPRVYQQQRAQALSALDTYLAPALAHADTHPACSLLVIVPTAPIANNTWDSLTPCFFYTSIVPQVSVMQSATTQTWGLVAARDFAPTVLHLLRIPLPIQMTGAPMEPATDSSPNATLPRLHRLDTLTRLNQQAQTPFFSAVGVLGGLVLLLGLGLAFGQERPQSARVPPDGTVCRALFGSPAAGPAPRAACPDSHSCGFVCHGRRVDFAARIDSIACSYSVPDGPHSGR